MTAEQYWNGDPYLTVSFRAAQKLKNQQRNEEMWINGMYVLKAINVAIDNMFKKPGQRPSSYLEEPLDIIPKSEREKEREAQKARQKIIDYYESFAQSWKGRGEQDDNRKSRTRS